MIRELELINKLTNNPFLEDLEVSDFFRKIFKKIELDTDSLKVRRELSGKNLFADVQADGME